MIKEMAWNTFKNTGNIDAFMIMRDIELAKDITPNVNSIGEMKDGNHQNQGDSNQGSKF